MTLGDLQCDTRHVEGCEDLVDVLNVVVNIIGEDYYVVEVNEKSLPIILCEYNAQSMLATNWGVSESEWHSGALEHAGVAQESRVLSILIAGVYLTIPGICVERLEVLRVAG